MTDTIDERVERYYEFLKGKISLAPDAGFEPLSEASPAQLKPHQIDICNWAIRKGRAAIFAQFGLGKALKNGTNVLTPTGWVPIESLKVGDAVIGSDGQPCNVKGVFPQGVRPIYRVTFSDRTIVDCDQDHLWYVQTQGQRYRGTPGAVLTTQQLIEKRVETLKGGSRLFIPLVKPIEFEEKELGIDPYTLGVLLGDGGLSRSSLTVTTDSEIVGKLALPAGIIAIERKIITTDVSTFSLVGENRLAVQNGNPLMNALRTLGLGRKTSLEKSIPHEYLFASVSQRLKLLQGLLDTDGCPTGAGQAEFSSSSKQLALDAQFLVESLGGTASLSVKEHPKYVHNGEVRTGSPSYRLFVKLPPQFMLFTLQRKIDRQAVAKQRPNPHRAIERIDYVGEFEATCISVDSEDSLFVTEHCIVTHNTRVGLQLMKWVHEFTGEKTLIVAPLGVRQEFTRNDGPAMGMLVKYCRTDAEVEAAGTPFIITNYERVRDGDITVSNFAGSILDEASCLRSFGSRTTQTFFDLFKAVPYRFVATATPSPNEYKELTHYAHYLGVLDSGNALTRWFQRDGKQAGHLTLMPHMEGQFWLWLASWAMFLSKPSDLGYSDEGYDLPPLNIHWHRVDIDYKRAWNEIDGWGQAKLFPDAGGGLKDAAHERSQTMSDRVQAALDIVRAEPEKHWIIWHDLEAERHLIEKLMPEAVTVYGSQDLEKREDAIVDFSNGKFPILAVKPSIAGSGCNFQRHCADAVFCGPSYKFNDILQAVHRIYRFLQTKEVNIHFVYAETQASEVDNLKRKWAQHDELIEKMQAIVKRYGLNHSAMKMSLERTLGCDRVAVSGDGFTVVNNDTVPEAMRLESDSMDMILTSIPFSKEKTGFYEYTPCYDEETEVLTRSGWKSFEHVTKNDSLATVNPSTLQLEWQSPSEVIWRHYEGEMLHFRDRNSFDLLVTPDHKMFVERRMGWHKRHLRDKNFQLVEAKDIASNFIFRGWRMLASTTPGGGEYPEYIDIPQCEQRILPNSKNISRIKSADFMRLAGWYLSEGSCNVDKRRGRFTISQCSASNPSNRKEIIELLKNLGLTVTESNPRNVETWNISLAAFLSFEFGQGSYNLRIPRWVKDLHPDLLTILRDTMMKGDGNQNGMAYTSFSPQLQDDFQEICLLTGWRASVSRKYNTVRIGQKNTTPEVRNAPESCNYNGMIGCATVPNHTLVVRRNGKAIVCGNCYNDFGFNPGAKPFFDQMDFLIPEWLRVLKPGRIAAIHTKDSVEYGTVSELGMYSVYAFSDDVIRAMKKHGFVFMGRITIDTDVVRENSQTYRLGWGENAKDSTKMGIGSAEYVLLFRKWHPSMSPTGNAYGPEPVTKDNDEYTRARWQIHASEIWRESGDRLLDPDFLKTMKVEDIREWWIKYSTNKIYDYEEHVKLCEIVDEAGHLPASWMLFAPHSKNPDIWTDIHRIDTLNSEQSRKVQEMHVCPLQISVITRLLERFTNPGDVVYEPFAGIGSTCYQALKMGRKTYGVELNPNYFRYAVGYCERAAEKLETPTLFDLAEFTAKKAS